MSLSAALNAARSSLAVNASQTSLLSRNLAGANEEMYTRKSANVATFEGGVRIESIGRAENSLLLSTTLSATSRAAGQEVLVNGLEKLEQTVRDPQSERSPAAMVGALRDAIQQYASAPDNTMMARGVLHGAQDLAEGLRSASAVVQQTRQQADAEMAGSVSEINGMLSQLEELNAHIVRGTRTGTDVTANLDARDKVLAGLSEQIGIRIVNRSNNDVALYTDSGVTLFETTARSVTMQPTRAYQPNTSGNAVFVDAVPVTGGGSSTMQISSGKLAGLATLRDTVTVTYQQQLDEIARGVVETFAESDRSNPATLPTIPGLFTYSGAPAMPAGGTVLTGLAGDISVNPTVDPDKGGRLERLRDGGIGDPGQPGYVANPSGAASFSGRLEEMIDAVGQVRAFDPVAGADESNGLIGFAASSVSWLEASRQTASSEFDYRQALVARSSEALSNATGVNIDEEMTIMLELERSYQASAKIIATVDGLLGTLLQAVG